MKPKEMRGKDAVRKRKEVEQRLTLGRERLEKEGKTRRAKEEEKGARKA